MGKQHACTSRRRAALNEYFLLQVSHAEIAVHRRPFNFTEHPWFSIPTYAQYRVLLRRSRCSISRGHGNLHSDLAGLEVFPKRARHTLQIPDGPDTVSKGFVDEGMESACGEDGEDQLKISFLHFVWFSPALHCLHFPSTYSK